MENVLYVSIYYSVYLNRLKLKKNRTFFKSWVSQIAGSDGWEQGYDEERIFRLADTGFREGDNRDNEMIINHVL